MAKPPAKAAKLKHAIVLIHGAGRYGVWETDPATKKDRYKPDVDGWFKKVEETLRKVHEAARTASPYSPPFDEAFEIIPINYDSIFERFRQDWVKQAQAWKASLGAEFRLFGLGADETASITKFLTSAKADNFGWNNALDLVLYLAPTVREEVDAEVVNQLGALVGKNFSKKYDRWSVLAHSIGTIVFHHAYPRWMATAGAKPPKGPEVFCAASNLSALFKFDGLDPYTSIMRPGKTPSPATYLECRHALDALAQVKPFKPDWPPTNFTASYQVCKVSNVYIGDKKSDWPKTIFSALELPHSMTHYMHQPEIAAALWGILLENPDVMADIRIAAARIAPAKADDVALAELKGAVGDKLDHVNEVIQQLVGSSGKIDEKLAIQIITDIFGA